MGRVFMGGNVKNISRARAITSIIDVSQESSAGEPEAKPRSLLLLPLGHVFNLLFFVTCSCFLFSR